jgi:hypothetical protein
LCQEDNYLLELVRYIHEDVWKKGKHPQIVKARSLLCYWAVHD